MVAAAVSAAPPPPLRQDFSTIGLVGIAHAVSHFSQLVLAPLFPWLKTEFGLSYTQLGSLLTIFFVVSSLVQAAAGFVVDRHGPRPVLLGGLALLGLAALGYAASTSYWMLAASAVLAGLGNGVFHPADYTLLNRNVHASRLGHAYSAHGITGTLGWAAAPALVVPVALAVGWRAAMVSAAAVALAVLAVLWWYRGRLALQAAPPAPAPAGGGAPAAAEGAFTFLRIPAVWMCFAFFFFYAMALSVVQSFAPGAAQALHDVPVAWVAVCLSIYMVGSACGMVGGGFLARDPSRCERIVATGMGLAACIALWMALGPVPGWAVPVLFGLMGVVSGTAGPSRDMLVKRSTPANASGRVFGVVYAGLDIGQALAPLLFGRLMDLHQHTAIWVGLAIVQGVLIVSAFQVQRVRRTPRVAAAA
jgi:MFS family permease